MTTEMISVTKDGEFTVQGVYVNPGLFVKKGEKICSLKDVSSGPKGPFVAILAPSSGTPLRILVQRRAKVVKGDNLVEFRPGDCEHPTIMKNICAVCGFDLMQEMSIIPAAIGPSTSAKVSIVHSIPELKVSDTQAKDLGLEEEKRLLKDRRLVLLVDLDQTLIHTTNEDVPNKMKDVLHFKLHSDPRAPWYHTKIRPRTEKFLERISKFYELHIITFGARTYAHQIAEFLDKEKKFFSHRILSRDECFDARAKTANLSALFPRGDHMVCIIDDREDVWTYAQNLVHVQPYIFFKNTGDINDPHGVLASKANKKDDPELGPERRLERRQSIDMPSIDDNEQEDKEVEDKDDKIQDDVSMVSDDLSLSDDDSNDAKSSSKKPEKSDDPEPKEASTPPVQESEEDDLVEVEDNDDYLLYLEPILKNIHKCFYDFYDQIKEKDEKSEEIPDLKTVIPYVKKKVLQGCSVVFSGVVPTHITLEKSKAYKIARSLGAKVTKEFSKETTHLVAARYGTAKVNEGLKRKSSIKIVTPDWLWCCAERWEKVEELIFPLNKSVPVTLKPPAHCSSPEIAFAERCPDNLKLLPEATNPKYTISNEDLAEMDKEVDDMLTSESSSDSDPEPEAEPKDENESSEDSLTGAMPRGQKRKMSKNDDIDEDNDDGPADRFRRGEDIPSDFEIASQSDDEDDVRINTSKRDDDDNESSGQDSDDESDDDGLGAQLEAEISD